jgi:hypothetical protein
MNLKQTATILTTGGALAAWLAGTVTSNRTVAPAAVVERAPAIDARSAELATEIGRLRDRLRPSALPRQPGRNLFRFQARQAPAPAFVPPPPPAPTGTPEAAPAVLPMRFIGVAEDPGPDGPRRIAFISAGGQLFSVKEGETVMERYRVAKIAADVVELTDSIDGGIRRLALR